MQKLSLSITARKGFVRRASVRWLRSRCDLHFDPPVRPAEALASVMEAARRCPVLLHAIGSFGGEA